MSARRPPRAAPGAALAAALLLAAGAAIWPAGPARAAAPVVSNVTFQQRTDGSGIVDVSYDVADADGDTLAIALQASLAGGVDWTFPCRTLSGDVGRGVLPGPGKSIAWDLGADGQGLEGDFRVRVVASDAGVEFRPYSPRNYAILDWVTSDFTSSRTIQRLARSNLVVIDGPSLWNAANSAARVVDRIKEINPDCRVIGYMPVKHCYIKWTLPTTAPGYGRTLWTRAEPYLAYTTHGDTASDWIRTYMMNLLIPEYREVLVRTIVEFQRGSVNHLDGVFWDYFPQVLWIGPGVVNDGDPDLDLDGIGHWSDPDEMEAFRQAEVSLVAAMRDSLGDDFLQIFNGPRALVDSSFARLADAIHYERFSVCSYFTRQDDDMRLALTPSYPWSLWNTPRWPRHHDGLPTVLVSNIWRNIYQDTEGQTTILSLGNLFRAVSLLVDCWPVWSEQKDTYSISWPSNPITLGRPLGPAVVDGDRFSRDFEYGRLELEMKSGAYPNPFRYTIWENGQRVEELDIPYHFP